MRKLRYTDHKGLGVHTAQLSPEHSHLLSACPVPGAVLGPRDSATGDGVASARPGCRLTQCLLNGYRTPGLGPSPGSHSGQEQRSQSASPGSGLGLASPPPPPAAHSQLKFPARPGLPAAPEFPVFEEAEREKGCLLQGLERGRGTKPPLQMCPSCASGREPGASRRGSPGKA